jgi:hypothetical protein
MTNENTTIDLDEIERVTENSWEALNELPVPSHIASALSDLFVRLCLVSSGTESEAAVRSALEWFKTAVIIEWRSKSNKKSQ